MRKDLEALVEHALSEDIGQRDLTTEATVPEGARCNVRLVAKSTGVLSGMVPFNVAFECLEAKLQDWEAAADGAHFEPGDVLASFAGDTRAVLGAERTAMNFTQHLSGVAAQVFGVRRISARTYRN